MEGKTTIRLQFGNEIYFRRKKVSPAKKTGLDLR